MDVYQISSNESRLTDKSLRVDIGLSAFWSVDQTSSQATNGTCIVDCVSKYPGPVASAGDYYISYWEVHD